MLRGLGRPKGHGSKEDYSRQRPPAKGRPRLTCLEGFLLRLLSRSGSLPPCGGGLGWGVSPRLQKTDVGPFPGERSPPHPNPPPQGGREPESRPDERRKRPRADRPWTFRPRRYNAARWPASTYPSRPTSPGLARSVDADGHHSPSSWQAQGDADGWTGCRVGEDPRAGRAGRGDRGLALRGDRPGPGRAGLRDVDLPPFDRASVAGYAVASRDIAPVRS